jgi:hypothetical protein
LPLTQGAAAETPEGFLGSVSAGLDGELGLLDGGELTQALQQLAREGRGLRLLLDPKVISTREAGQALAGLSPTVQVRWLPGAGNPRRRLLADGARHLHWKAGEAPWRADGAFGVALARFETAWQKAQLDLPDEQKLADELLRLPDPSEKAPHFKARREGVAKDEEHEHADP